MDLKGLTGAPPRVWMFGSLTYSEPHLPKIKIYARLCPYKQCVPSRCVKIQSELITTNVFNNKTTEEQKLAVDLISVYKWTERNTF